MKRWLIAVAVLVGGAASVSQAEFVIIRAILGQQQDPNNPNQPGAPAPPGGPAQPPAPGPGGPRPPGGPGGAMVPPGGGMTNVGTAEFAVQGVVAIKERTTTQSPLGPDIRIKHRWSAAQGKSRLFNDNRNLIYRIVPIATPHAIFEQRKAQAFKGNRTKILTEAEWALTHGLYDEFVAFMDSLSASKEQENPNDPQDLKDAVKAYKEVKAALKKPSEGTTDANRWQNRLSAGMETSDHFAIIYTSGSSKPPEVMNRLAALENHMRAFYYWFAVKGRVLPVPAEKMVAVVIDTPGEFKGQRAGEDEPLVGDGFYSHRDNLCVFSAQRLDTPFQVFERQADPLLKKDYDRVKLLDGTEKRRLSISPNPADFARLETLALLEKALEDEGERAAVTHEGSRQLFVAANLIPRTVIVPRWVEFGSAAAFETPKGPFHGAPLEVSVALYPGVMGPSWAYLRPFKEYVTADQRATESAFLKDVVTDAYFNRVISPADTTGLLKARTSAWALAYYLLKVRLPGMLKFYQQLADLPRDLELDDKAILGCFARAFDVANATNDGPDPAKFEQLAKDWISHVKSIPLPGAELGLSNDLAPQNGGQGTPPGGAPQPGGRPGPGGPGRPGPGGPGRPAPGGR